MCGICGKVAFDGSARIDVPTIRRMTSALHHRGPDDTGIEIWDGVGFGHARLSIIDLESGKQPLANEDDTVWVCFNGEIYNHEALRRELTERGHVFKTRSDTEVLVHAYEEYGTDFVERLNGMFAFAIHDRKRRTVLLARDRVGIKPLYYKLEGGCLWFASEVRAILADDHVVAAPDPRVIDRFLTFYYVPGEATGFQGIQRLAPGHVMVVDGTGTRVEPYWSLEFHDTPRERGMPEATAELRTLLEQVVEDHLISDVPVGVLLSGGLDSSAVLGFARRLSSRPLATFTIGFGSGGVVDERSHARVVAEAFGTDHHELEITPEAFWESLPRYVWHMEDWVCEPPAVALDHVSRLASRHVKVLLSGEGGDEAFAGYRNYAQVSFLERVKGALGPAAGMLGRLLGRLGAGTGNEQVRRAAAMLRLPMSAYYFSRTSDPTRLLTRSRDDLYTPALRARVDPEWSTAPSRDRLEAAGDLTALQAMLWVDTCTWLPDDLLVKADKMTMANSVELRVPLLDHRVLEFAAGLPDRMKLRRGQGKAILRDVLAGELPRGTLERPKAGFPVPYGNWLGGVLGERVRELLLSERALDRGYFQRPFLARLVEGGAHPKEVFGLVVLELWHRLFVDGDRELAASATRPPRAAAPAA